MLVTANDMNTVISEIWSAVFKLPVAPVLVTPFEGRVITASVGLTGDVATYVVLRCDAGLASQIAAVMFDLDEGALEAEDLQDTVGEIANIVAGNVKTMLGGECGLSIPVVSDGPDPDLTRLGQIAQDDHYDCEGGHFAVTTIRPAAA